MHLSPDKKYKVIQDDKELFGTPEKIVLEMSWWDRSRPKDDPSFVKDNYEYMELVSDRLNVMDISGGSFKNECEYLSFLDQNELIEIEEAN